MGEKRDTYRVFVRKPVRKKLPARPRLDGSTILKYILKKKWELVK
jgi:hypothetical protein